VHQRRFQLTRRCQFLFLGASAIVDEGVHRGAGGDLGEGRDDGRQCRLIADQQVQPASGSKGA